jgi:hypothetical protein
MLYSGLFRKCRGSTMKEITVIPHHDNIKVYFSIQSYACCSYSVW